MNRWYVPPVLGKEEGGGEHPAKDDRAKVLMGAGIMCVS